MYRSLPKGEFRKNYPWYKAFQNYEDSLLLFRKLAKFAALINNPGFL